MVARMNRSTAATTAAASSGDAFGATIESCGRRFISSQGYLWAPPKRPAYLISCTSDLLPSRWSKTNLTRPRPGANHIVRTPLPKR